MSLGFGNILLPQKNEQGAAPGVAEAFVLDLVTEIATFDEKKAEILYVKDQARGGNFLLYTGVQPDDQGIIFTDALGRLWKRIIEGNYISVQWFGAVGVTVKQFDSLPAFNAAIAAGQIPEFISACNIYVPGVPATNHYYMSDTLTIDNKINLFGDGKDLSLIQFQNHKTGIVVNYITASRSTFSNFAIKGFSAEPYAIDAYGFDIKTLAFFENVSATAFDSHGFYMYGHIDENSNTNNCIFINCEALQNRLHGFYMQGADANHMSFISCSAVSNGGLGFYDKSFLGNSHTMWHLASNGSPETAYQRGLVSDGTNVFGAIQDGFSGHDTTDAAYWANLGNTWIAFPDVLPYDPTTIYYRVGAFVTEGLNQYSAIVNCYTESDQAPAYLAGQTFILSGLIASQQAGVMLTERSGALSVEGGQLKFGYAFTAPRLYIDEGSFGVGQESGSDVIYTWDETIMGAVLATNQKIFGPLSTAAMEFRTNVVKPILAYYKGFLMKLNESNTNKLIQLSGQKPTSTAYDAGDIVFNTPAPTEYIAEKPEVIMCRRVTIPTAQWVRIVAMCEYEFQTTSAANFVAFYDQLAGSAINTNIRYDIDMMAVNKATGDVFAVRVQFVVYFPDTATNLVVKNSIVLDSYSDASLSGCLYAFLVATGNKSQFFVNGIAATTLNWKVQVRRIPI